MVKVWVSSLSLRTKFEMSTGVEAVFTSPIQSPGVLPLDSTSLILMSVSAAVAGAAKARPATRTASSPIRAVQLLRVREESMGGRPRDLREGKGRTNVAAPGEFWLNGRRKSGVQPAD